MSLNAKNKKTIDAYYAHANSGDFSGALQYLSEDVIYRIPGPIGTVAYSGEWRGRDRVMMLFEAFNASFGIVDMTEIRSIATENDAVSMNDEIFTARGTGRPWRVGVAHHMRFNTEG